MKVRIKETFWTYPPSGKVTDAGEPIAGPRVTYHEGQEIDLPTDEAELYIAKGHAESAGASAPEPVPES